jgi:hypothetical protein
VVAENLEAMVQLGLANSRMKDFYDLAVLARDFDFDAHVLARAVRATFDRRKTPLPTAVPVALTEAFAHDPSKRIQWSGFLRKAGVATNTDLASTLVTVRAFVEPLLSALAEGEFRFKSWRAGRGWD